MEYRELPHGVGKVIVIGIGEQIVFEMLRLRLRKEK